MKIGNSCVQVSLVQLSYSLSRQALCDDPYLNKIQMRTIGEVWVGILIDPPGVRRGMFQGSFESVQCGGQPLILLVKLIPGFGYRTVCARRGNGLRIQVQLAPPGHTRFSRSHEFHELGEVSRDLEFIR